MNHLTSPSCGSIVERMTEEAAPVTAMEAFDRVYAGRMITNVGLVVGHESGLLARLALGPGTATEVAADVGTDPRMTLEWLRVMTVGGFATFAADVFTPVEGLAELLVIPGVGSRIELFVAGVRRDAGLLDRWVHAIRTGEGIAHEHYEPVSSQAQDVFTAPMLAKHLLPDLLGSIPTLLDRLESGCAVMDLGCGSGRVLNAMATAYPRSHYTGYDLDRIALERASVLTTPLEATVNLELRDAADLPMATFDVVVAIDSIHDLGDPEGTLRVIAASLREDGVFVMAETDATGDFSIDQHAGASWEYFTSLSMCIPVSQAAGGPGLGSMWGRGGALPLLEAAGFSSVAVTTSPTGHAVYACRVDGTP